MREWKTRAIISSDVVFFNYAVNGIEQQVNEVFVWDLDKTYLDTNYGTVKELWRTITERAFQKRNIPGTSTLIQALRDYWVANRKKAVFPIYFITASPPQMEERIKAKLQLDGIQAFGCFYKDNLQNLRRDRLWRLTQQVGYKLQALLQLRSYLVADVNQIFWGDDSESDAIIYNLYSDICLRRIEDKELRAILKALHVVGEQTEKILELQAQIPVQDPVSRIYINLAADTDPDYYLKFGRRTLPTLNTFQTAVDLFQHGRLQEAHVIRVAQDMVMNYGFSREQLALSFDDLIRRQVIGDVCVNSILPLLQEYEFISVRYQPSLGPLKTVAISEGRGFDFEGIHDLWVPERIDYLHDYR